MFIGAHEAEYMFVTTLLKIEQHLLAQGRCPYKLFSWHISLRFDSSLFEYGFDPASFIRYLGKIGEVVHLQVIHQHLPMWRDFQAESCYLGLELDLVTDATKEDIEEVFEFIRELSTLRILPPDSQLQDYLQLMMSLPEEQELLNNRSEM